MVTNPFISEHTGVWPKVSVLLISRPVILYISSKLYQECEIYTVWGESRLTAVRIKNYTIINK